MFTLAPDILSPLTVESLQFLCFLALALSALSFMWLYFRQRRDLETLRECLRALTRSKPTPRRARFRSEEAFSLWRGILTFITQKRMEPKLEESSVQEVLAVGRSITNSSDEISTASEAALGALRSRVGRDILSIAIVLKDESNREKEGSTLRLLQLSGLPRERIEEPLLSTLEQIFDGGEDPKQSSPWGYDLGGEGSALDFRLFGVGMSLLVPLRDDSLITGAIWLGFKRGALSLTPSRKAFLQGLCEHTAASLSSAKKFHHRFEQTNKERDWLLGLSHDLRAPGNAALYAIRDLLASKSNLSEEETSSLSVVESSLLSQLGLLDDVLDFARHQRGSLNVRRTPSALKPMVEESVSNFKLLAEQKNIELKVGKIPDEELLVDARHFRRIFGNLLSNAIKYTDTGSVRITFEPTEAEVSIHVTDTGRGIPKEQRDFLFQEFTRLQNVGEVQGAGLGLAVSRVLAELNEGSISFAPHPGGGSIFSLVFEKVIREEEATPKPKLVSRKKISSILVIDDDRATCRTNMRYLQDLGETLDSAESYLEAKTKVSNLKPELIVSDLNLSDGTAAELLAELEASKLSAPTIVVSGSGETKELDELETRFNVTVLQKPVDRELLIETATQKLDEHQRRISSGETLTDKLRSNKIH